MLLAGGHAKGHQVVPSAWLERSWTVDPDIRGAFRSSASEPYLPGGWYRNQFWFVPRDHGDVLLCLGIDGQMVYVNRGTTQTVGVKLSSWPDGQSPAMLHDTLRMFDAMGAALADLLLNQERFGVPRLALPGLATGLARARPFRNSKDQ
jgi:hypothetical protein